MFGPQKAFQIVPAWSRRRVSINFPESVTEHRHHRFHQRHIIGRQATNIELTRSWHSLHRESYFAGFGFAIIAWSLVTVFIFRAVPDFAAGILNFERPMPSG